jgi:hypothetical protein
VYAACKAVYPSSILGSASKQKINRTKAGKAKRVLSQCRPKRIYTRFFDQISNVFDQILTKVFQAKRLLMRILEGVPPLRFLLNQIAWPPPPILSLMVPKFNYALEFAYLAC